MEEPYLLTLSERSGENEFITRHIIYAEDEQMVKYHYHRTLKNNGYEQTNIDKHVLECWDMGTLCEIEAIYPLDMLELDILKKFLPTWHKVE